MKEYPQEPLSVYSLDYTGVATPINCNRFASLLAENWEMISYEPDEDKQHTGPDLIILPSSSISEIYVACRDYRRRWSFEPFILGIAGEAFNPADGIANYSFSYQADSLNHMYYPSCIMFIPYNLFHHNGVMTDMESSDLPFRLALTHNQADLKDDIAFIKGSFPKQRFCNFVAGADSTLRRDFVKQLQEYKQVDCAGSVLNNTDELQCKSPRCGSDWAQGKLRYIAQYRFTVTFENKSQPFYVTEKILHPLMVGSIPIYWGAPNIAQFFNPASFINCHDYASFDAVIERIKEIDSSPELYQQYLNAPKVLPDSLLYDYTGDKIKAKMNDVLQKVVAHKQMRKQWHWTNSFRFRLQHPKVALKFHIRSARNDFLERYPRMRCFLKKIIRGLKSKKFPSTDFGVSTMHKCWISDHHVFTMQGIKQILKNLGVSFYDCSLTGDWKYFYPSRPAETLQVLDKHNANMPYNYEHYDGLASEFAEYYGKWSQENVDFFWCSFKAYMAHVYSKCNRPIVLHLGFEGNMKSEPEEVEKLIAKLVKLHTKGQLIILASNLYDKMYFEYFTDINVPIVRQCTPSIKERYQPIKNEILIGPGKERLALKHKVMQMKEFFANEPEITIKEISELYPRYEYSDLCKHKAIIVLPYTIYTGSIVEYLVMGIPLFMPSIDLLSHWHVDDHLLAERKNDLEPMSGSIAKGKLFDTMPNPNDDDLEAVKYWLKYCDWYQWPIETFSSLEELKQKLLDCDFDKISENMLAFGEAQYRETTLQLQKVLKEVKTSAYN